MATTEGGQALLASNCMNDLLQDRKRNSYAGQNISTRGILRT